ncbi:competence protein ComEC [Alkalibacillus flavidus]|uniref:Competence protein ComEC n=2 Tax=Alkalibacillus flavidus TaxID=546021 RepID=A0ABV2KSA9_9BACI
MSLAFGVMGIVLYLFWAILYKRLSLLIACLILFTLSLWHTPSPQILSPIKNEIRYHQSAHIISDRQIHKQSHSYMVQLDNGSRAQLFFPKDVALPNVKHGATCQLDATLTPPTTATNPGQFDYAHYLTTQGIVATSYHPMLYDCEGASILSYIHDYRHWLIEAINTHYQQETVAWLTALIFGDRALLQDEVIDTFQFWNLSHLLAISGLHVGLTLGLFYIMLQRVIRLPRELVKLLLLVVIPLYIVIAGANPPVIRAGMMASLFLVLSFLNKRLDATDVLSIVCLVVLWVNPFLMFQVGFQFSFAVTLALILSKRLLMRYDHWLWQSLIISIVSQLAILPIQLTHFYFTNVLSPLANLVMIPFYTVVIIPFSLLLLLFVWFPLSIVKPLETMYLTIQEWMIQMFYVVGQPDVAIWVTGVPHLVAIILFYAGLLIMMRSWEEGRLTFAGLTASATIIILIVNQMMPYWDRSSNITMLDVGQAEAIVVELPHREGVFIFDVGEEVSFQSEVTDDNYQTIIKPFLWSKGIRHVDAVWLTHFDYDHVASAPHFINDFSPDFVFTHPFGEHADALDIENTFPLKAGDSIKWKDTQFSVLAPSKDFVFEEENERSLVVLIDHPDWSLLMTGDTTESVEEELIHRGVLTDVDILKVAHHGSQSSSSFDFLDVTSPDVALISAGRNNPYNHPSPEVYERLVDEGIDVYRTDQNGAIMIEVKNGQRTVAPFLP